MSLLQDNAVNWMKYKGNSYLFLNFLNPNNIWVRTWVFPAFPEHRYAEMTARISVKWKYIDFDCDMKLMFASVKYFWVIF